MNYRSMGQSKEQVSLFGIGTMRLPLNIQKDGRTESASVDEAHAIRMIRSGIDQGVNYIDTAYPYHRGSSERVLGKALKRGYREKVKIATKLPGWEIKTAADFDRILNEQLERLQVTTIDYYLLHALSQKTWDHLNRLAVFSFLERARSDGRIRRIGFSFHDELPVFKQIVDSYDWDMAQIQLNLLDENYQAGLAGLEYAAARGLGVVIMEPLRGGRLAGPIPDDIMKLWQQMPAKRSPAEWAFRWLADLPGVSVILSGVSNLEQLEDNVRIFSDSTSYRLSAKEQEIIRQVQARYRQKIKVDCTSCQYCQPCPSHVKIPDIFELYNDVFLFDDLAGSRADYQKLVKQKSDASLCIACGQCEAICPQNLSIIDDLIQADLLLREN